MSPNRAQLPVVTATSAAGTVEPGASKKLLQLRQTFEEARAAIGGAPDLWFRLAEATVRVRFAGATLAPLLTAPLAHLQTEPTEDPALDLFVWDDASTGVVTPLPSRPPSLSTSDEGVFSYRHGEIEAAYEPSSTLLSAIDHTTRCGFLRVESPSRLSVRERTSPFRTILSWWGARRGLQIVHASAVGTPMGGVLIVGRGGAGKSTTVLSCVGSGLGYAADDGCLVSDDDRPIVYGMYATAKVERRRSSWFPRLETAIESAPEGMKGEAVLRLTESFTDVLIRSFPLRGILVADVRGAGVTTLEPCSRAEALQALAPSTIFQFPGVSSRVLARLTRIVRRTDCYRLALGLDVSRIPGVIIDFLATESS